MVEIFITIGIVLIAGFILYKSIKNSKEGKCSGGCKNCSQKNNCSREEK